MKNISVLDARMAAIAENVSDGAVAVDVGCDHGYVAINLINSGKATFVIASDVNRGPLESAVQNARRYGVSDRIKFVLSDGLDSVDCCGENVTDVVIAGMGGELTLDIISRSEYIKQRPVRLILQPMTTVDCLRKFLAKEGFSLCREELIREGERIYELLVAEYDGKIREISDAEALIGKLDRDKGKEYVGDFIKKKLAAIEKKRSGLLRGGHDVSAEDSLIEIIKEMLNSIGG